MNKENVTKWIAALRSGEYKQTREVMVSADGAAFCCLGVAACLAGLPFGKEMEDGDLLPDHPYNAVADWLGVPRGAAGCSAYITRNDHLRLPFSAIADYAEAELREDEKKPA